MTNETNNSPNNPQFLAKLKKYRLSLGEYERMKKLLGREPQGVEWALFSALWSEHCSYKSSKIHLRKFSYQNEKTRPEGQSSEGENAGVVDLGLGERVVFKMESHNHPSFIEPFHGSATGVGGILRDVFTMGARPIALANYLCFGEIEAPRMKDLYKGVIHGISHYGNCVGVPMLTGKTQFHRKYNRNILVNAMAVGYMGRGMKVAFSKAQGIGNYVVYVGAKTGADGVHGASMASESFEANNEAKRPNIQIGDPFFEKLLIEACLEAIHQDLVVAIQDMGAAGLTSSSFEMASKGNVGLKIHLDKVPLRNRELTAEDILLSESQERMLLICEPTKFKSLEKIFHRWGLDSTILGEVIPERKVKLFWNESLLCEIDPWLLTEEAPRYERPFEKWVPRLTEGGSGSDPKNSGSGSKISDLTSYNSRDLYEHFDQRVGGRTAAACDQSVGFVRLPESGRGLAVALGCRSELMEKEAQFGAMDAAFFPILQMASKGASPLALTDCLNFGNPEKVTIMSEFVASVEALAQVAEVFDSPVVSGNVSFYNETQDENIVSTPAVGVIGLRKDVLGIPSDSIQDLSGKSIVSVEYKGLFFGPDRSLEVRNGFLKDLSSHLARLKDFHELILSLGSRQDVVGSKVLGYESLEKEMTKILGQNAREIQASCVKQWQAQGRDEGRRPLYMVVFAVNDSARSEIEAKILEHLGSVEAFWLK